MSKKKKAPEPEVRPKTYNWFTLVVAPLLFLLGTAIVFSYMLTDPTGARLMGIGDAWAHGGPMHYYMDYAIHQGELPLWNPLIYCGQPFAANPQSFLFHPPNLLRSLLTFDPTPWKTHVGIAVLIWFQVAAGGYGTYLLARRHGLGYGPALAAGFAYAFSGGAVTRGIGHWQFHNALMWAPFLLIAGLAMLRADTTKKRVGYAIVTGVLYGMILLAGTPHFMVLLGFMLGLFVLFYRIAFIDFWVPKFLSKNIKLLVGDGLCLGLVVVIGVLVASPMLVPAAEYSQFSPRAGGDSGAIQIIERTGPAWSIWQLFTVYSGDTTYEGLRGSGAVILLLALCGLAFIRQRAVLLYGLLFFAVLDCSLNEPYFIGKIFFALSPYQMSGPPRGVLVACLPLGMLAAFGLEYMTNVAATTSTRTYRNIAIIIAAVLVVGTLIITAWDHPYLQPTRLVFMLPIVAAFVLLFAQWKSEPLILGAVVAMLAFGETALWNQSVIPWWAKGRLIYAADTAPLREPQTMWADNRRGTDKEPNVGMFQLDASINGYDPLYIDRVVELITPNNYQSELRRKVFHDEVTADQIRGHLFLKRSFWLARQYVSGPLPDYGERFPSATTVYTRDVLPPGMPRVTTEEIGERALSENTFRIPIMRDGQPPLVLDAEAQAQAPEGAQQAIRTQIDKMPPQHTVLRATIQADCEGELQPMLRDTVTGAEEFGYNIPIMPTGEMVMKVEIPMPDFEGMEFALVPTFNSAVGTITLLELYFVVDQHDEGDKIEIVERRPNATRVRVNEIDGPRILSFIDSAYPGWSVTIDGEPAKLITVNEAFKGVYLNAGSHELEFSFSPMRVYLGIAIGLVAFAASLAAALRLIRM